jgi:hypothetical protein
MFFFTFYSSFCDLATQSYGSCHVFDGKAKRAKANSAKFTFALQVCWQIGDLYFYGFLLNRNAFGKISRLVNIQPADGGNVIGQ